VEFPSCNRPEWPAKPKIFTYLKFNRKKIAETELEKASFKNFLLLFHLGELRLAQGKDLLKGSSRESFRS
jgi:hypothetical protein